MKESLGSAKDELKRADHSIYVSLKYTRTVDMIKHIIDRFVNSCDFIVEALLKYAKQKKKIKEIPDTPLTRLTLAKHVYKEDPQIIDFCNFSEFLRKLNRAEYKSSREFRRHVTMHASVDGALFEIKIDTMYEYYKRIREFVEYVELLVEIRKE